MCVKSPLLKGRPGRQVWEYLNVRRFYRRLVEAMKAENPDALLVIHTHGQPRALAAWADFVAIGEGWNVLFRGGRRFREIAKDPSLYDPDYFQLSEEYLEAQLLPPLGGVTLVLPQVKHAMDPERPQRAQRLQRAFFARILPFGVPVWMANSEPTQLASIFEAIDRFGPLSEARLLPFWEDGGVVGEGSLRTTVFAVSGRALVVVANWGDEAVQETLSFDRSSLLLSDGFGVRDAETRRRIPVSEGGQFRVRVPARDLRLLEVR